MGARIMYQTGDRIPDTRLTFLADLPSMNKRRQARFKCDCGSVIDRDLNWVRFLDITSCGCYKTEVTTDKNLKHGHATRGKHSGAYRTWAAMHQRVKVDPHYAHVSVCERWSSFENFYADMGDRPDGGTIERVNNLGDYEPDNCIWASRLVQSNNTSSVHKVTIGDETRSINEWCRIYGITYARVKQRRTRQGMDIVTAITTPIDKSKQNRGK